ncbi:MAG: DUF998 domain-containing protein [Bryobacteraceae bacterium]
MRKSPEGSSAADVAAGYITLSSAIYYVAAVASLHLVRTDFDPGYRYLSEYARGPYGALMTSTFFVLSAGSLALCFGLCRSVASIWRFVPGLLLWLVWAVTVFLAGIFTGDVQGTPHTPMGRIHDQLGMIAFSSAALAVSLVSLCFRWEMTWRSIWRPASVLSLVVVGSFLALDRLGQMGLGGLDQRLFLAATLIWMAIIGSRMLAIARTR